MSLIDKVTDISSSIIWQTRFLLSDCSDNEVIQPIVESFLQSVQQCAIQEKFDAHILREACEFIKELSFTYDIIASILLDHIKSSGNASPYLDILPTIYSSKDAATITDLATTLLEQEVSDDKFITMLKVLLELPVDSNIQIAVQNALKDAVGSFSPSHFPGLLKLSLQYSSNTSRIIFDMINLWRKQLGKLSIEELSEVLEVLWELLPSCPRALLEWVELISEHTMFKQYTTMKIAASDLSVLLISLTNITRGSVAQRVQFLLQKSILYGNFPFNMLKEIITLSTTQRNQAWVKLSHPIWALCLVVTDMLASPSGIKRASRASLLEELSSLVSELFAAALSVRESIVTTLLAACFPQAYGGHLHTILQHSRSSRVTNSTNRAAELVTVPTGAILLPPLGRALPAITHSSQEKTSSHLSYHPSVRRQQKTSGMQLQHSYRRAAVAVAVLKRLCTVHSMVGQSILRTVLERIGQHVTEPRLVFPSIGILQRLLSAALTEPMHSNSSNSSNNSSSNSSSSITATASAGTSALESSVMILIQKLLGTIPTGRVSSLSALFSANAPSVTHIQEYLHLLDTQRIHQQSQFLQRIPQTLPLQAYTGTTLGVLLAAQLLLRHNMPISIQDRFSLLSSLSRTEPLLHDVSVIYALDTLCISLTNAKNVKQPTVIYASSSSCSASVTTPDTQQQQQSHSVVAAEEIISRAGASLHKLLERVIQAYSVCTSSSNANNSSSSTTTAEATEEVEGEDSIFEQCTLQLFPYSSDSTTATATTTTTTTVGESNEVTNIEGFHWKLALLSKKLVSLTQINTLQVTKISETTVNYLQNEIEEICTAIYQLVRLISTAKLLLQSPGVQNNIYYDRSFRLQSLRLSFPSSYYNTLNSNSSNSSNRSSSSRQTLDSGRSTELLLTWSSTAADAFVGEFLLPAGLSVTHALRLAWERGLVVALLTTHFASRDSRDPGNAESSTKLILMLLCQLHSSRLMLRAAYTPYVTNHSNSSSSSSRHSSKRRNKHQSAGNSSRKRTFLKLSQHENQFVTSGKTSSTTVATAPSKYSKERMKAEIMKELQKLQCIQLQRLLSQSIKSVPYTSLIETLHYMLQLQLPGHTSSNCVLSSSLLTDAGLALVSQFVYRLYCIYQVGHAATTGDSSNAKDRFASVSTAVSVGNSDQETMSETDSDRERALTLSLLTLLPALLDRIELSRTSQQQRRQENPTETTAEMDDNVRDGSVPSEASPLMECMGEELDRQGCKVLALNLFMLLETCIKQLSLHSPSVLLEQLYVQYTKYEAKQSELAQTKVTVPLVSVTVPEGVPPPLGTQGSQLATVYDSLEKRLLQQHDCMLVSAGMGCLFDLLHHCSNTASSTSSAYNTDSTSTTVVEARCSSIAWTAMRSVYTESIYLSVHLHLPLLEPSAFNNTTIHEGIPGMDENWSQLVKSITSQTISIEKIISEIELRSTKRTYNVLKLLLGCFHTKKDFQHYKSVLSTASMDDHMYTAAYRQYWAAWWASEVPAQRVYGVAVLIREVVKLLLLHGNNDNKNKRKNISSSSIKNKKNVLQKRKKSSYNNNNSSSSNDSSDTDIEEFNNNKRNNSSIGIKKSKYMAAEHILNKDYMTPTATKLSLFPFLSESTLEFHLSLSLPLFPALFLLSTPNCSITSSSNSSSNNNNSSSTTSNNNQYNNMNFKNKKEFNTTTSTGPYQNFIHISMLFIWLIQHFYTILVDKHEHLQFLIRISSHFLKIVRTMLPSMELTINRMILWRNNQTLSLNDNSYSSNYQYNKYSNTNSRRSTTQQQQQEEGVDIGSLEYLQCMLNWAYKVGRSVNEFVEVFQEVVIQPGNITVASGLRRELPGLRRLSEQLLGRIASTAKAHSLKLSAALPSAHVISTATSSNSAIGATELHRIGDKAMFACMTEFLTRHHATVLAPLDPAHIQAALNSTTQERVGHYNSAPSSGWGGQSQYQQENEEASEGSDYEFAAITSKRGASAMSGSSDKTSTSAAGGWGLYNTQQLQHLSDEIDDAEEDSAGGSDSGDSSSTATEEGESPVENSSIYEDSASQFDSEYDGEFEEEDEDDYKNTTTTSAIQQGEIDFAQYDWDSEDGLDDHLQDIV